MIRHVIPKLLSFYQHNYRNLRRLRGNTTCNSSFSYAQKWSKLILDVYSSRLSVLVAYVPVSRIFIKHYIIVLLEYPGTYKSVIKLN